MRLIDADIFASELDFAEADVCEEFPDGYCEFGFSREKIKELLRDTPTVDAVPVVRCRECKYRGTDDCIFHIKGEPADEELLLKLDNDFCSYGERKGCAD